MKPIRKATSVAVHPKLRVGITKRINLAAVVRLEIGGVTWRNMKRNKSACVLIAMLHCRRIGSITKAANRGAITRQTTAIAKSACDKAAFGLSCVKRVSIITMTIMPTTTTTTTYSTTRWSHTAKFEHLAMNYPSNEHSKGRFFKRARFFCKNGRIRSTSLTNEIGSPKAAAYSDSSKHSLKSTASCAISSNRCCSECTNKFQV